MSLYKRMTTPFAKTQALYVKLLILVSVKTQELEFDDHLVCIPFEWLPQLYFAAICEICSGINCDIIFL